MNLQFFPRVGPKPTGPGCFVSLNRKGIVALNAEAETTLGAELGGAAALCLDTAGSQWLLAHWPDGGPDQCQLRAPGGNNRGIRFSHRAATNVLFAPLPAALLTLRCLVQQPAFTDAAAPGAQLYALVLPEAAIVPAPARAKEPGVGSGNYTRAANRTAA